ncbi:MAG: TMEM165/GDT1 family protein [Polaromonas sp.]|nr:TMEM165/GDT1 family protein [Polaromonas sp.]
MEAFLVSTGIVALAEMGDKTQLLALILAARFKKPWPIAAGILVATLVNHALAGDAADEEKPPRYGVFFTTVVVFFLAEMGDKTQIATVMLAARYDTIVGVVAGTTLGMMLANAPVVWLGERVTRLVPLRIVHIVSALIFAGLGLAALLLA